MDKRIKDGDDQSLMRCSTNPTLFPLDESGNNSLTQKRSKVWLAWVGSLYLEAGKQEMAPLSTVPPLTHPDGTRN